MFTHDRLHHLGPLLSEVFDHQRHVDLVGALLGDVAQDEGDGEQRAGAAHARAAVHHDRAVGLVHAVPVVAARVLRGGDSVQ